MEPERQRRKADMNNIGVQFEIEFCELLGNNGFWAHRLSENMKGAQPFDVIAMKNGRPIAIECKVVGKSNRFPLRRVEDNQVSSLTLFKERGGSSWFAFKLADGRIMMRSAAEVFYHRYYDNKEEAGSIIVGVGGESFEGWVSRF